MHYFFKLDAYVDPLCMYRLGSVVAFFLTPYRDCSHSLHLDHHIAQLLSDRSVFAYVPACPLQDYSRNMESPGRKQAEQGIV